MTKGDTSKTSIQSAEPFRRITPKQRARALQRQSLLKRWLALRAVGKRLGQRGDEVTADFVRTLAGKGTKVCRATLYRWNRSFRIDGVAGLIDQRPLRGGRLKPFGQFFLELERVYAGRGLLDAETCHMLAAEKATIAGWAIPLIRDSGWYIKKYILPGLTAERGGMIEGTGKGASIGI